MLQILRQIVCTGVKTEPVPRPGDAARITRLQRDIIRTVGRALAIQQGGIDPLADVSISLGENLK